jgi:hypothetical protein
MERLILLLAGEKHQRAQDKSLARSLYSIICYFVLPQQQRICSLAAVKGSVSQQTMFVSDKKGFTIAHIGDGHRQMSKLLLVA